MKKMKPGDLFAVAVADNYEIPDNIPNGTVYMVRVRDPSGVLHYLDSRALCPLPKLPPDPLDELHRQVVETAVESEMAAQRNPNGPADEVAFQAHIKAVRALISARAAADPLAEIRAAWSCRSSLGDTWIVLPIEAADRMQRALNPKGTKP